MSCWFLAVGFIFLLSSSGRAQVDLSEQTKAYDSLKIELSQKWVNHRTIQEKTWNNYRDQIKKKWNDDALPSTKIYVEYWDSDLSRIKIDYEIGRVIFETISQDEMSKEKISEKIKQGLISSIDLVEDQIQIDNKIIEKGTSLHEVSARLGDQIEKNSKIKGADGVVRNHYKVEVPMVPGHIKKRALKYIPLILF